ncbi:MAG: cytidine deaminase [Bdellovibrionales bacterium]|nr:cytidine deaminase [Bdellovibrionales bacterium]
MTEDLRKKSIEAMKNSYSPYSKRQVGAAIRLSNGKVYSGCNIENSSFGATVCAERVAVWKAVSENGGDIQIVEVVVATEASPPWSPCGLCRQVINEFVAKNCEVYSINPNGDVRTFTHHGLLPNGFDRSALIP